MPVVFYYLYKTKTETVVSLKTKSLEKSMATILKETKKYLDHKDPQVLALQDYQLILGVTQVLWEDQVMNDVSLSKPQVKASMPVYKQKRMTPEEEFDLPEMEDKKVLH